MWPGIFISVPPPFKVMDEVAPATRFPGVPEMALLSVKVCAPTVNPPPSVNISETSRVPPMLTPPLRLAVRLPIWVMEAGMVKAFAPFNINSDAEVASKSPPVKGSTVKSPVRVNCLPEKSKLPLVNVRLFITRLPPRVTFKTSDVRFTTTLVVIKVVGNSKPVSIPVFPV